MTELLPTDRRNDCDIPNCYACERLARLQAEYQRDCVIEELASMQADIERLAGIVNDRVEELRAVTKERDRLRKALNDAGDEFKLSDCEHTSRAHRIIERALLTKPTDDVPAAPVVSLSTGLETSSGPETTGAASQVSPPDGYAYRYSTGKGSVIRFTNGDRFNGCEPMEKIPYYFGKPVADEGEKL
jgi:hypothetical protein